jgi:DUF971 family protein
MFKVNRKRSLIVVPKKIKKETDKLTIIWNDDRVDSIKLVNLRHNCPCAICTENKEAKGKGFIPLYKSEEISIENIQTVGNYALGITWKDGHNTGIYDFDYLMALTGK